MRMCSIIENLEQNITVEKLDLSIVFWFNKLKSSKYWNHKSRNSKYRMLNSIIKLRYFVE